MSNLIDTSPTLPLATLVEFSWGLTPTRARYTTWSSNLTVAGNIYTSLPTLFVDYGDQHGGTQDVPAMLTMPRDLAPCPSFLPGMFTPTHVRCWEVDPADHSTLRETWGGRVAIARFNPAGKTSLCELTIRGRKAALDRRVGLQILRKCGHQFGDPRTCERDMTGLVLTATISAVSRRSITTADAAITSKPAFYWQLGHVSVDGFAIGVHYWLSGGVFQLVRDPPPSWVGASALWTPGCDKTLDGANGCRFWGQEHRFNGIGLRMPRRNPIFQANPA